MLVSGKETKGSLLIKFYFDFKSISITAKDPVVSEGKILVFEINNPDAILEKIK